MFGYLRPYKPELKIKDFSVYKAVYCGLCHSLGRRYGFLSRMILSYDATLMCMLNMSLEDSCCGFEKRRCPARPHKKCDAARQNPVIDFWADISVILGYYKLRDNLHDGGAAKKTACVLALPYFSSVFKKASKNNPFAAASADEYIKAQAAVEEKRSELVDEAAQPTAQLMARLLSHHASGEAQSRVLTRMGLFLGRWIYIADAADDIAADLKSGCYNPFAAGISKNPGDSKSLGDSKSPGDSKFPGNLKDEIAMLAEPLLNSCIFEITAALELLQMRRYNDIIGNIFYLGLPEVKKAVLSGLSKKEKKKRFSAIYEI